MSKVDRAIYGPGWGEVIFGALLSLVLGVVLGALLLVLKPVVIAKETPKEPVAGAVYYIEGARDASAARQVMAKRKALVDGQSIKVTEQDVNALVEASGSRPPATPAKPGAKAEPAPAAPEGWLAAGEPNVRIRNGSMQIGVPVTLNVLGFSQRVIAQARGGFTKDGSVFVYDPSEMYLGSCPIQRLPFVNSFVRSKVLAAHGLPDDITAAWAKLANVTIEGNTLNLAMR
jgi:hypothetical protein